MLCKRDIELAGMLEIGLSLSWRMIKNTLDFEKRVKFN